ncbi:GGDEF domain-containing protein [Aliidiomarina sanyensis]|uniref:Diguanylate cyclase n=1 Tax=Aliidiomarina sanyensis TaxID=1249555 RepID=A0A432WKI1_9GAMM|nr:sensor domain-containing diguanylate cyclase [Aliidiomarina sanyensis]RUO34275.1 diguanylate cyclase [Aliidiomarina sanyensis]
MAHSAERKDTSYEELAEVLAQTQFELGKLKQHHDLINTLLESVNAVLWAFDWRTQKVLYVSPAYNHIFGRDSDALLESYDEWKQSIHPDDLAYAMQSFAEVIETGANEARQYRIIRGDGEVRWLSDKCFFNRDKTTGNVLTIVGIAEDITEKKEMELELIRLATTDTLTQAMNRRHFFEKAQKSLEEAIEKREPISFILIDIDNFKDINDTYGHQMGDRVLRDFSKVMRGCLRGIDSLGRVGGEEFAAVFPRCNAENAMYIANRLQYEIRKLAFVKGIDSFHVTVSQGLTQRRDDDTHIDHLFSRADKAMYAAKEKGKNQIVQH